MISAETFGLIRTRWLAILALALAGVVIASIYVLLAPREYSADTQLLVSTDTGSNGSDLAQGGTFSQQQARNYSSIANSEIVLTPVIHALDLDTTPDLLARQISASIPLNTSIIAIQVTDSSPSRASAIADAVTTSLVNTIAQIVPADATGHSPVQVKIIQHASPATKPSSPNAPISILAGFVIGLILGLAIVIIHRRVSSRVRTAEEASAITGAPVLGTLRRELAGSLITMNDTNDRSIRAEEFRQVRTNVNFLQTDEAHRAYAITSSVAGEGKSTVAANLAASFAEMGKSVVLVDADLRSPSIARYLDLEESIGFTTVLGGDVSLEDALQDWGYSGLKVLACGEMPPNPSELLGSRKTANLINRLRSRFEIVIIDTPPIVPVTDAAIIGNLVGGVFLVVGFGRVRTRELEATVSALRLSHAALRGTIVNFAPAPAPGAYGYGRTGYGYGELERRKQNDEADQKVLKTAKER